MNIQVLVATTQQKDFTLIEKMNLRTNAIICNQCNEYSYCELDNNGNQIKWFSFAEKGVGLNRNNALMRAESDICIFADDDLTYFDNYEEIVKRAYNQLPDADIILFNLKEKEKKRYTISKIHKVNKFNYLRYGTARITIKLSSIKLNGIYFNECFGGGTEHRHGEDNLFLSSCLKNKLKVYAYPQYIATLNDERASTWNEGYDDKYFNDQGLLYKQISRKYWRFLCIQDAIRHYKKYNMNPYTIYKKMIKFIKK